MKNLLKNNKGVTLIEIIVVLILVAILTAGAGMGIIAVTRGYLFAGKNAEMAQKINIAMKRITKELQGINLISNASTGALTFTSILGTRTIGFHENAVKLAENADPISNGDIIIDNISSLAFSLKNNSGNPWSVGDNIHTLTGVTVSVTVIRNDTPSGSMSFTTTVYLRKNKNSGGTI